MGLIDEREIKRFETFYSFDLFAGFKYCNIIFYIIKAKYFRNWLIEESR